MNRKMLGGSYSYMRYFKGEFFIVFDLWVMSECEKNGLMVDGKMKRIVFGE